MTRQAWPGRESGMARMKAVNLDASKIRQIKGMSQVGWLGISRSVETEADWSLPAMLKPGSWSQCLIIVTEWECGLHATRASHFPKGAKHLAFLDVKSLNF